MVTYVLTDGSSTNASTLSISVTPVTDDFSDNDEQVTIDEDSGEKTGNVIDGVSVDGPVTVQSFSIAGQTGPFVLGQVYTIAVWQLQPGGERGVQLHSADNYNGAVPVVTYVLTDGSSTNASTLSISVTPVTDDFSDNDEQVTIDEDSGEKTGNVIDGVSVDGPVTVQSFSIAGQTGHCAGSGIHHCRCGQLQPGGERGVQLHPGGQLQRRGAGGHLCAD
ncbi:hypothetical protein FKF78_11860 [Aeromonas hydrophila]|nr:hypothetical protein [Aeromonas hydrophila]